MGARHPASARISNNPPASMTIVDCHRFMPDRFRRAIAQPVAASSKASVNKPLRPGDSGSPGGIGRERGALAEGAVVVTVTVTVVAVLPRAAGFGVTVQVDSLGFPAQVKLTVPVNPPSPPTSKWKVAGCPAVTVAEGVIPEDRVKVKSRPVPLSVTLCGLLPALSEIVRLPVLAPP